MANEILVIERSQVIFFLQYQEPPIVIGGEPQPLGLPSSSLPSSAAAFLSDTPQAAERIDNGLAYWQIIPVERAPDETIQHLLARYKEKWAKWAAREDERIQAWAADLAQIRWIHV